MSQAASPPVSSAFQLQMCHSEQTIRVISVALCKSAKILSEIWVYTQWVHSEFVKWINKVIHHKPDLNTPALTDKLHSALIQKDKKKTCITLSQFHNCHKHSSEVIFSHSCNKPTSASLSGAAHYRVPSVLHSCMSVWELCAAGSLVCLNSQVDHSSPLAQRREE